MRPLWQKFVTTLEMIKFSHSIFALPFALIAVFYATDGHPNLKQITLIIAAMVAARNAAMSFNRWVDRDLDALNPRTQNRALVNGELSLRFAIGFCVFNALVFLFLAAQFNHLTLWLAPVALTILFGYSLTKRFTHYTQFFLGIALGCAPLAAWIALTGTLTIFPILIGLGVFFWVAGFDLIYATQDFVFDRQHDVKSLVVKLGIARALLLARWLHMYAVMAFFLAGASLQLGFFYFGGLAIMASVLVYEHSIVKANDLSRVNQAFFTLNGTIAILFSAFSLGDLYFG